MKKLLLLIPIFFLSWCSLKWDFWKQYYCNFDNGDARWILVWQTDKQYMLLSGNVYSVGEKESMRCSVIPPKWIDMLNWYEYLSVHFTK